MSALPIPRLPSWVVPWVVSWVALALPACGTDDLGPGTDVDAGPNDAGPSDAGIDDPGAGRETALLVRRVATPGGGARFAVLLEDADGHAMTDDRSSEWQLAWSDGQPAAAAVRYTRPDPTSGHLLIMLVPDDEPQAHAELLAGLADLIARRPAGERIALYRWSTRIDQLAAFTHDRAHLLRILERVPAAPGGIDLAPSELALAEAAFQARQVGNDTDQGLRAALLVGRSLPHQALDIDIVAQSTRSVPALWAFDGLSATDLETMGPGRAIDWLEHGGLAGALLESEARIDAFRDAYYEFALCGVPATGGVLTLAAPWLDPGLNIILPAGAPEDQAESLSSVCNPGALLDGVQPYPELIEFWFTPDELTVYQQRVADESKEDFRLSVQAWADGPAITATAHLRGQGSLRCERRNYTLDLDSAVARHWLPGSATDEFYLLSMCQDDRYVRAHTVYQLYALIGAFPPRFRYVELRLQGQSRGVYMLMEKPKEKLVDDSSRARSVVRRGFRLGTTLADIKYTITTVLDAENTYYQLLDRLAPLSGAALDDAFHDAMDGYTYLRLLAMNSLLHSGDYVDEMWLTSTETLLASGAIGDRYSVMGWDPDDIFSNCHYSGNFAYIDPYGLSYCAEAEIDHLLLADPVTYGRYVDILEALIAEIDPSVFQQATSVTGDALIPALHRPGVAPAMLELLLQNPAASDPNVAEAEVLAALATLEAQFSQRRQQLIDRIAIYRSQNP